MIQRAFTDNYRLLAIELISLALKDLKRNKGVKDTLAWFNERSDKAMGYGWALHHSGGNPNVIRRSINEIVRT